MYCLRNRTVVATVISSVVHGVLSGVIVSSSKGTKTQRKAKQDCYRLKQRAKTMLLLWCWVNTRR